MLGQRLFLVSCLVIMTSCWRIDVSEKNVAMQLSLNVTLDCRNHEDNDNNLGKFKEITKLRILKRKPNNQWISLAKVERRNQTNSHVETSFKNVMLTGNASNRSNSFLKLQFPFATDYVIGQFVCEVEGYYSEEENLTHEKKKLTHVIKTEPVVIIQRDATYQDIVKVISQFKQQKETKDVNHHILFVLLQKIIHLLELKDNENDKEHLRLSESLITTSKDLEKVNDRTKQLADDINSQTSHSDVWPAGTYALLKSETGCPYSSTFYWRMRSFRIVTKPVSENFDRLSTSSHLSPDTIEYDRAKDRFYPFIRICSKTVAVDGPAWPKGSYCIVYHNGNCPNGFRYGRIELGTVSGRFNYMFCCRNDGSANTPIELPSRDPFYLYRYGGTCQKVKGMKEINEWMTFDTYRQRDKYYNAHPDGQIKLVKVELCYYKPNLCQ